MRLASFIAALVKAMKVETASVAVHFTTPVRVSQPTML